MRMSWWRRTSPNDALIALICTMALGVMALLGIYLVQRIQVQAQPKRCLMNYVFVQIEEDQAWMMTEVRCLTEADLLRLAQ